MRYDEFALRVPGEDEGFRIRFHEHLTVLAGVGSLERQALIDAVVGALTGEGDATTLTCTDYTGRPMELTTGGGRVSARFLDDGTPAPVPVGWYAPDAESLRSLVVLTAADLAPDTSSTARENDPPELAEARATLRELAAELAAATDAHRKVEAAQAEVAALDARIKAAEGDAARREYAKVLAQLERVRAEAAALQSGGHGAETDRHLLASADEARALAAHWVELAAATAHSRLAAAGDEALPDEDLADLAQLPPAAPGDIGTLVAAVVQAADHVAALEGRLRTVASASLPEPDDSRILGLATVDQDELWAAHARVVEAREAVAKERVAVGGIGADGERAVLIDELEAAHAAHAAAAEVVERRRVPVIAGAALAAVCALPLSTLSPLIGVVLCAGALVGTALGLGRPWRARAAAAKREATSLQQVGVPSYLGFHLRRVDATIDRAFLGRLGIAEAELDAAGRAWTEVSGGVDVDAAAALELRVRDYAAALASRHGAVQEVSELRRTLDELAVPDLVAAQQRLAVAAAAYGLSPADVDATDPSSVATLIATQVELGHIARRHQSLTDAEADEEKIANRLDDLLVRLGFADGPLEARVGALDWAIERAREREVARTAARPREAVEADLTRLNAEVRRLRRPEWTEVSATDAELPDVEELTARRDAVAAELDKQRPSTTVLERLTDRHAAVERRVAALEVQLRGDGVDDGSDLEDIQQYLLAALTKANNVGPRAEPVPILLDDPFVRVPAERKWELMDLLRRLSEQTQLLYLTDDPFVGAWARRRADTGAITLLEPVE